MQAKQKQLEKELRQLKARLASGGGAAAAPEAPRDVNGVKFLTRRVDDVSGGDLRNLADEMRSKLKSGVVVLGSVSDSKVTLLTAVTKDLVERLPATLVLGKLAPIVGGKGGGKPDLAQAGGKDPAKLDEALDFVSSALAELTAASR